MEQEIQKALTMLSGGRANDALGILLSLEKTHPSDSQVLEALGHCYLILGKSQNAKEKLIEAHQMCPQSANIAANLGGLFQSEGNLVEAQKYFAISVENNPQFHQAWHFLSLVQCQSGNMIEGLISLEKAKQTDPLKEHISKARSHYQQGHDVLARNLCNQILGRHKSHPQALCLLANATLQQGQLEEAENYLLGALAYSPYDMEALMIMAQLQGQLRQYSDALTYSEKLVKVDPENKQGWQVYADNLLNAGKFEQAIEAFAQVNKIDGSDLSALLQQAHTNKILGNNPIAIKQYLECTHSDQSIGSAFWALASMSDYQFSLSQIEILNKAPLDPDMNSDQACQATFALAKHHEDLGNFDRAFELFRTANINRAGVQFMPAKHRQKIQAIIDTFRPDVLERSATTSLEATPIFIVGLPRSGSTLIEQILASHSQIEGTMELKTLPSLSRKIFLESCRKNKNNTGSMENFSAKELHEFGQWYMRESEVYRTNKPFFIDKLPPNYQHIGLIRMILPQAVIIDARRQPLACGLGIYKQYFGHGHDFSYNLDHIGIYYNQYLKLMDYWQNILPDTVLLLQHEALVNDTEAQIQRLLAHCNLPFEQQCLAFHENKRAVRTASSDQVRQPINRKGTALWKHYQHHLAPLEKALGKETLARFSEWIDTNP